MTMPFVQNLRFRTAFKTDQNLSLSGNIAKVPFRASLGYSNVDGTLKKYDDITVLKKDLEILLGYEDEDLVEESKTVFNFIKIKTTKQASQGEKKNDKMSK